MSDFYLAVCKKCKEYVDLEKWNPNEAPTNAYRSGMQKRLECFKKRHQSCNIVMYSVSGYSSDGTSFPATDKLTEVCK